MRTEIITVIEDGEEIERNERPILTLAELKASDNERGYQAALEKLAEWSNEYGWWDATIESEHDHIRETYGIGYDPKEVTFDLYRREFSFGKTTDVDERKVLKKAGIDLRSKVARQIIEDERLIVGFHHTGGGFGFGWIGYSDYESIPDWIGLTEAQVSDIREVLKDAEQDLYKTLVSEQDYLTSEENLLEWAEANDYRFYDNGEVA